MSCYICGLFSGAPAFLRLHSESKQQIQFEFIVMANTAQARKRARQSVVLNAANSALRSRYRTAVKGVRKAIEAGDKAAATLSFRAAVSVIDKIADKKIVHKNKAARHKSRLAAALKGLSA